MDTQPDLTFYFAIHRAQRAALGDYRQALSTLTEPERRVRGKALARWAKGFIFELEEHHSAEDDFFFPSLRAKVASASATIDGLEADHRRLDDLLARWPAVAASLADPAVPFAAARADAVCLAEQLADLLHGHLDIEDRDLLPTFWRHYTAAEYDAVVAEAMRHGKKSGMWFIAPFSVDCLAEGADRDAFLASVPAVLRLLHRLVRPSYDRLLVKAFGARPVSPAPVTVSPRH